MLRERSETEDAATNDAATLEAVAEFFSTARFPDRRPEISAEYDRCRKDETSEADDVVTSHCGALGFYLFCSYAERWGMTNDDADCERANELLADERVRTFLFDLYGIEIRYRDHDLVLHASGTTSFIIKGHYLNRTYHRVVKIIKPWYLADPVIADQTQGAKAFHDRHLAHLTFQPSPPARARPIAPNIEYANRHCIIMAFVEGETLRQYFTRMWSTADNSPAEFEDDPYVALNRLVRSLCGMMKACHQAGIAHGDLSSTNILIKQIDGELPELLLIDFGINYLLTRNLEYTDQASAQIASIDPDVMKRKRDAIPTLQSDIYSLGVILTEGLLGERYRAAGIQVLLDEVYDRHAGVGAILDDLLDPVPSRRLPGVPDGVDPYDFIANRFDVELRAVSSLAAAKSHGPRKILEQLLEMIFPRLPDIIKLCAQRIRGGAGPSSLPVPGGRPRLDLSALSRFDIIVPGALNLLIASIVIGRIAVWDPLVQGQNPFTDSLKNSWLAWLVVLACSSIASRYVLSIFAGWEKAGLPRALIVSSTLCIFAPWIPLFLILFRYADQWPFFVAGAGTILVANNLLWYRFCKRAIDDEALGIHISPLMRDTKFWLGGWSETSGITLICVYAIAVLTAREVLHDVTFYAVLIVGAITPRVYFSNLQTDAPAIRTGLQRFANGYRRAMVDPERRGTASS